MLLSPWYQRAHVHACADGVCGCIRACACSDVVGMCMSSSDDVSCMITCVCVCVCVCVGKKVSRPWVEQRSQYKAGRDTVLGTAAVDKWASDDATDATDADPTSKAQV